MAVECHRPPPSLPPTQKKKPVFSSQLKKEEKEEKKEKKEKKGKMPRHFPFKTKPCVYFHSQQGFCPYQDQCIFAHGITERMFWQRCHLEREHHMLQKRQERQQQRSHRRAQRQLIDSLLDNDNELEHDDESSTLSLSTSSSSSPTLYSHVEWVTQAPALLHVSPSLLST